MSIIIWVSLPANPDFQFFMQGLQPILMGHFTAANLIAAQSCFWIMARPTATSRNILYVRRAFYHHLCNFSPHWKYKLFRITSLAIFMTLLQTDCLASENLTISGPSGRIHTVLQPAQLAVVINDDDTNSVAIGEYYQKARDIPARNMVHVRIPGSPRHLTVDSFFNLKQRIEAQLNPDIQLIVLLWTTPLYYPRTLNSDGIDTI